MLSKMTSAEGFFFFLFVSVFFLTSCSTNHQKESNIAAIDSTDANSPIHDKDLVTWEGLSKNPKWVTFHNESFYFYLSGTIEDEFFEPSSLMVIIPGSKHTQTIDLSSIELLWWNQERSSFVNMIDVNLDGYEDMLLFSSAGATGNIWYDTWLFDSIASDFVHSREYSDLCCLSVTKDRKMVKSYWRSGYYEDTVWYFTTDGFHEPILLKKVFSDPENNYPNGFKCWKVTVERINGKWVETQRVIRRKGLYEEEYMGR